MSLTIANQVCLQEQKEKNLIGKPVVVKKQTNKQKVTWNRENKKDTIQPQGEARYDSFYGVIWLYPLINANSHTFN